MTTLLGWIMPESASTLAGEIDALIYFIVVVSLFFFVLITAATIFFCIRFRRRGKGERTSPVDRNNLLTFVWAVIPAILLLVVFVWGFRLYMKMAVVPANALQIKVTGQQWFWSFAYDEGQTTKAEIVVPVNRPVKLLLSSKDVIHSFFVPAFRIKQDALPNRNTVAWFEATQTGEFPVYCAEYCGTNHSKMLATVKVVTADEFAQWLGEGEVGIEEGSLVEVGKTIYKKSACFSCHSLDGKAGVGPSWKGIFGKSRPLADGSSVKADENYIRESILNPKAKLSAGFGNLMPTYQGLLKERDIDALIAYIKSLAVEGN